MRVQVTSDWSKEYLVLAEAPDNQFNIKEQYEILREYTLCDGVASTITENQSTRGFHYSQANGAVLVRRRALGMFFMLAFRPFAVTSLGFCVFALQPGITDDVDDNYNLLNDRITIILVLLLASAVEPRKSYTTFTFIDIYTSFAFLMLICLCLETVLVLSELFVPGGSKPSADTIGFGVLGSAWILVNIVLCVLALAWHFAAGQSVEHWTKIVDLNHHLEPAEQQHHVQVRVDDNPAQ